MIVRTSVRVAVVKTRHPYAVHGLRHRPRLNAPAGRPLRPGAGLTANQGTADDNQAAEQETERAS